MEGIQELSVVKYSLVEGTSECDELKVEKTYGIRGTDSEGNDLIIIEDICLDLECIQKFINDLNVNEASIHHIDELVENFLNT